MRWFIVGYLALAVSILVVHIGDGRSLVAVALGVGAAACFFYALLYSQRIPRR